jgi:hypothetical protein
LVRTRTSVFGLAMMTRVKKDIIAHVISNKKRTVRIGRLRIVSHVVLAHSRSIRRPDG